MAGNQILSNAGDGIDSGTNDSSIPMTITGNTITSNSGTGISNGDINAVISNNIVSGQTNTGHYGIVNYGHIINNTVFHNYQGIYANGGNSYVQGNRVYGNLNTGIFFANGATVTGNLIYSNGTYGVSGGNNGAAVTTIANNLIYGNTLAGFNSPAPAYVQLLNNTIYQLTGTGVTATNSGPLNSSNALVFRNNIVEVAAGPAYSLDDFTFPGFKADYNDIYITGTGSIATIAGHPINTIATWVAETTEDLHSIWVNPQFVSPAGADGILGYSGGVDHGGDDNFHTPSASPVTDAGAPTTDLINEPLPNGNRINIGFEGGTSAAATSPATTIQVTSPTSLERLQVGSPYTIQWQSSGLLSTQTLTEVHVTGSAVGEWNAPEYVVTGGQFASFSGAVDTSGVTDPAPAAVYQNMAFSGPGVGSTLAYQIPVSDGTYTIRLDFAELNETSPGTRTFDIKLQGQTVASAYDIFAAAGNAQHKATALNFPVTASGGSGISLKLIANLFSGATLCGFRILSANPGGAATQTANVQVSTDNGSTWNTVATNQPLDSEGRGSFVWTPTSPTTGATALVRVVANDPANTTSAVAGPFLIAPVGNNYYVNANSTGGVYTTAAGSDANDGKSPATPMSSIQAILNAYQPGAGATIYVDSGTYTLLQNITLTSANSGLTIEGTPALTTILNRGNTSSGDYVFNLLGASNVTLDHLAITGGNAGINAPNGTSNPNLTISNDLIYSNYQNEISTNNQSNWVITGNTIHDTIASGGIALYMPNNGNTTFSNNVIFNNSGYGFFVQTLGGQPNTISGNTVYANGTGIYGTGPITISGNTVYSNATRGIDAESGALVVGNNIYKQTATNAAGLFLLNNVEVRSNLIYDNYYGISSSQTSAIIDRNKIYSNTNAGITLSSYGIPQIIENLIYSNAGPAISMNTIFNPGLGIIGNTIYQINADAVKMVSAPGVLVRNNILWTQNGYDLELDAASQTNFTSDYNDLNTTGSAKVGFWGGAVQATLANWQSASSKDAHSISADPKFVDFDGADNVLGYSTAGNGSNDGGDDNFYLSAGSPGDRRGL